MPSASCAAVAQAYPQRRLCRGCRCSTGAPSPTGSLPTTHSPRNGITPLLPQRRHRCAQRRSACVERGRSRHRRRALRLLAAQKLSRAAVPPTCAPRPEIASVQLSVSSWLLLSFAGAVCRGSAPTCACSPPPARSTSRASPASTANGARPTSPAPACTRARGLRRSDRRHRGAPRRRRSAGAGRTDRCARPARQPTRGAPVERRGEEHPPMNRAVECPTCGAPAKSVPVDPRALLRCAALSAARRFERPSAPRLPPRHFAARSLSTALHTRAAGDPSATGGAGTVDAYPDVPLQRPHPAGPAARSASRPRLRSSACRRSPASWSLRCSIT